MFSDLTALWLRFGTKTTWLGLIIRIKITLCKVWGFPFVIIKIITAWLMLRNDLGHR